MPAEIPYKGVSGAAKGTVGRTKGGDVMVVACSDRPCVMLYVFGARGKTIVKGEMDPEHARLLAKTLVDCADEVEAKNKPGKE